MNGPEYTNFGFGGPSYQALLQNAYPYTPEKEPEVLLDFAGARCGPYWIRRGFASHDFECFFKDWRFGWEPIGGTSIWKAAILKCTRHAIENKWIRFCPTYNPTKWTALSELAGAAL